MIRVSALLLLSSFAFAETGSVDYSKPEHWLCQPGREDACTVDLSTTIINANGSTKQEKFTAANNPDVDCFYVYPTVSMDPTENSDMVANKEEHNVIASQFARFQAVCKTYAPLYRQITLPALRQRIEQGNMAGSGELAFADVENAFDYYLKNFNNGRPFVLVGHSQGSRMLTGLIKKRIDHSPLKNQMVSALLIGAPVQVKANSDRGGSFQNIPLCQSNSQTGCVIAYASFRHNSPPPENSLFGKPAAEGLQAACTNPAALNHQQPALLDNYLGSHGAGQASQPPAPWVKGKTDITTPFVKAPGLLSANCIQDETGSYLAVTVNSNTEDARVDDIVGDVTVAGVTRKEWGLHLVDISIAQGDLINLVQQQAAAWQKLANN